MTQIGIFIFDQRFKQNNNISDLLIKKIIQIGKNSTISDFYEKILLCVDHAIKEQKAIKNNDDTNTTIHKSSNDNNINFYIILSNNLYIINIY